MSGAGVGLLVCVALLVAPTRRASAIPSFARKYGTSCTTCHTVYPKLGPFGEAFRRNGFRFPGADSEMTKAPPVSLGSEAYKKVFPDAVWPGSLPGSVPLSVGFNGQVVTHPQSGTQAAKADNDAAVVADNLVEEGHLWAGGSFDEAITFFSELTATAEGFEIERAVVGFDDLVGPDHLVNLWIGKGSSTVNSFGPHSSYLGDSAIPGLGVRGLFGAQDSWNLTENYQTLELNGVVMGRVDYSLGVDAGTNAEVRSPHNAYAHLGVKLGGVRLDGESDSSVPDAAKPWAETALTLDAFAYHSSSRFGLANPASTEAAPLPDLTRDDNADVVGGTLRAQWTSLELDAGVIREAHDHPAETGGEATVVSLFGELSYVVYPWLVPAVRVESTRVAPAGRPTVSDLRFTGGVAALVRPNLKAVLALQLEQASGGLPGGWGSANGAAATTDATTSVPFELEAVSLGIAYAY